MISPSCSNHCISDVTRVPRRRADEEAEADDARAALVATRATRATIAVAEPSFRGGVLGPWLRHFEHTNPYSSEAWPQAAHELSHSEGFCAGAGGAGGALSASRTRSSC
mmetsp:Transcript_23325/g.75935  ORF Transcript_23325/g.75935 Transcript_23325/m.75935 type:complete len:109 (-) Transcript_23325:121-447(-)